MGRMLLVVGILAGIAGLFLVLVRPDLLQEVKDRARRGGATPYQAERQALHAALASGGFRLGAPVFLRVFKREAELEVWLQKNGRWLLFKTFPICRFSGTLGPKHAEGDRQAPEGFYYVSRRQMNPHSRHHLSFNLGFPNAYDKAHGRTGSYLMIHGGCSSIGCYAMTDGVIEQVYRLVEAAHRAGQRDVPVHAFPFRMEADNMRRYGKRALLAEWQNLKEGYDLFARSGKVPAVLLCGQRYGFGAPRAGCQPLRGW